MPEQVMLRVFANPFCVEADADGRAHGHIRFEPSASGRAPADAHLPFVGCHLTARPRPPTSTLEDSRTFRHVVAEGDRTDWEHIWEYDTEPTLVPQTAYYMRNLQLTGHHGPALLPADLATYKLVHGTAAGWRDARARLHQYVQERKVTPRLRPTEDVQAKLARRVHPEASAAEKAYARDHEAEWMAFVGEAVEADIWTRARDHVHAEVRAAGRTATDDDVAQRAHAMGARPRQLTASPSMPEAEATRPETPVAAAAANS